MAGRRALSILPSTLRGLASVAFQPAELQGVYNFGASSGIVRPGEIGEVSGVPDAHLHRKVIIYSPARVASQQGVGNTGTWRISFESTQKWENPLMGWTSTGDPYHAVGEAALIFDTKEAAMEFASKYGWEYTRARYYYFDASFKELFHHFVRTYFLSGCPGQIKEPHQKAIRTKAYADNFKWKGPVAEE